MAEGLIAEHHKHLLDYAGYAPRMEYVFRDKAQIAGGKMTLGTMHIVSNLNAFLADREEDDGAGQPFFCMVIAHDSWLNLTVAQREALVDHELCHCGLSLGKDDRLKLHIVPHDVEEFAAVLHRHGTWEDGLQSFMAQAKDRRQAELSFSRSDGDEEAA
jgi:hypothetical protein